MKVSPGDAPCGSASHDLDLIPSILYFWMQWSWCAACITGCMSILDRCHFPTCNIKALPPSLRLVYFHITSLYHQQTPRIWSCCAYGDRVAHSIPRFCLVGRFLCAGSTSYGAMIYIYSYSVLKFIRSENARLNPTCLCLESQFRSFHSSKHELVFLYFILSLQWGQYGSSIVCSKCHDVPIDRYPLHSSIIISL